MAGTGRGLNPPPTETLEDRIRRRARELGFDAVGITRPDAAQGAGRDLMAFLAEGRQGDMAWLAREPEKRSEPRRLWPEVRSLIVVGANYGPESDPLAALGEREKGVVSVYARRRDYHDVLKKRLRVLARELADKEKTEVKLFVDTAPVMEKPLAQAAGLGWQGKHSNLVSREFGSWLFLGAMFTTLELEPDAAEEDHCGACRACLDACPTGALDAPYRMDARRCVSYLTIETKGQIPRALRSSLGNRVFGCDDCLAVCPWNKFAKASRDPDLAPRDALAPADLAELAGLDDAAFRARFAQTPVKRAGRDRFVRNVLVAIGNSADPRLAPLAQRLLDDAAPLVRGMAIWALARLLPAAEYDALRWEREPGESDPDVAAEWSAIT
ncbi:MAG: tRNA epoxyqueuosine(34) reductase QueG [Alphaproteobacteria bacterium]|nr:tRNA epoxyqueuosine(34) reductase QueG [Alphaproteobacteria bacterium]